MAIGGAALRWTLLACTLSLMNAQEMQPRAYVPAPVGLNFFVPAYSRNAGGLLFDPSLPVLDAHIDANIMSFGFGQSIGVLGRSAQVMAVIPYVQADLTGIVSGAARARYLSGLGDSVFRYAMNIYGAPAMGLAEFARHRQKTIVGASLTVSAPTGQYDPNVLVNIGTNRWAFKPEVGVSRPFGKWIFEGALGAWFYTPNHSFNGGSTREQRPLGSIQAHVVRVLPHRTWAAFDATYFTGGRTLVNEREDANYQGSSRLGVTFGFAVSRRQAIKISYFNGVTARVGSDIGSLGVSYNIIWMRGR